MAYGVEWLPSALKGLGQLDAAVRPRILRRVIALEAEPRPLGAGKLAGAEGFWRIRAGDYRVVYTIDDANRLVLVVAVGHRREVYRRKPRS